MTLATGVDAIVIGGSYAGIAASLQLARARRRVLVVDAGIRRNRFAAASHGVLGQDGRPPAAIVADARAQLLAYPTVAWIDGMASEARQAADGFAVTVDGVAYHGRRIVLALGVSDELPAIPGLQERWGVSVFHCPYCHGYELNQGPIGVLATGPMSIHQALLVADWGPTTLLTNGAFEPDEAQVSQLASRGVAIERGRVLRVAGQTADIELGDGSILAFAGLFTVPTTRVSSPIAAQLGCAFEEGPSGSFIGTDPVKATSVAGVFACGDAARAAGSVSLAIGDGAMAGAATHRSLFMPPV